MRVLCMAWRRTAGISVGLFALACTDPEPADPKACDEECRHNVALRGVRETLKLIYNITLQGDPVGAQDQITPCPLGGGARVYGEASSNPQHGATIVDLTYQLGECRHLERDEEPPENYDLSITGTITQLGTLAAQPSATTALILESDSIELVGTVYDPPLDYEETDCAVALGQNGNHISGTLCGHVVGLDL